MSKRLTVWILSCGLALGFAGRADAFFHNYRINEIYSNADGSIQFIELLNGPVNGENFSNGQALTVSPAGGGASNVFVFPSNLPSTLTANTSVLIATQGFADLGIVTPNFIIPPGFLFTGGGTVALGSTAFDTVVYAALPTNGILSLDRLGTAGVNSPRNFAGITGSVPALALQVFKTGTGSGTVTSNPAGINCGGTCSVSFGKNNPITLSAASAPGSVFAGWSGEGCSGTGTCTVTMSVARSVTATFNVITDTTPNPFSFAPQSGVLLGVAVISAQATITGINSAAQISVTGGDYSIDGGTFTNVAGTITDGQAVRVRVTSSSSFLITTSTSLNIGGVSATFDVTTGSSPDAQPPTVPTGLTTPVISSDRIVVAWNASTDNVGVTQYKVYRDTDAFTAPIAIVAGAGLSYSDTGLTASSAYAYRVSACDALANCSVQSASIIVATLAAGVVSAAPNLVSGFNLSGNPLSGAFNVVAAFGTLDAQVSGISTKVDAVWAWNAARQKWQFHTPQFTAAASAEYALANNYEVLSSLPAGAGYWVSATVPVSLPAQTGTSFDYDQPKFDALPPLFNLLSTGSTLTVQQFNASVGVVASNFNALWAWDAVRTKWYFYSPQLEQPGSPFSNAQFGAANGYQDFAGDTPPAPEFSLQPGVGFWVER